MSVGTRTPTAYIRCVSQGTLLHLALTKATWRSTPTAAASAYPDVRPFRVRGTDQGAGGTTLDGPVRG
ncbi:unnamed protein product, partial [Pylaiella littoralis]